MNASFTMRQAGQSKKMERACVYFFFGTLCINTHTHTHILQLGSGLFPGGKAAGALR